MYLDSDSIVREIDGDAEARAAYDMLENLAMQGYLRSYTSNFSLMEALDQIKYDEYLRDMIKRSSSPPRTIVHNYRQDRQLSSHSLGVARSRIEAWVSRYTPGTIVVAQLSSKGFLKEVDPFFLPYTIALHSAIFAPDAVHFSYALLLGCDLLLSSDYQFCKEINRAMSDRNSPLRKETFQLLESMTGVNQPQKKNNKLNIPIQAVGFKPFVKIAQHWRLQSRSGSATALSTELRL